MFKRRKKKSKNNKVKDDIFLWWIRLSKLYLFALLFFFCFFTSPSSPPSVSVSASLCRRHHFDNGIGNRPNKHLSQYIHAENLSKKKGGIKKKKNNCKNLFSEIKTTKCFWLFAFSFWREAVKYPKKKNEKR